MRVIRLCALLPAANVDELLRMAQRLGIWGTGVSLAPETAEADAARVGQRLRDAGLVLVQVGSYQNLASPVEAVRTAAVQRLARTLQLASIAGARAVVTGAGHCDPAQPQATFAAHPDNFAPAALDRVVRTCQQALAAAGDCSARLLVEPWVMTPVPTLTAASELVRRVGHPHFGILFDPVNLMNLDNYFDNGSFLRRAVQQLGTAIGLVHAKDTLLHPERFTFHLAEEPVGSGALDYPALLEALSSLPGDVPLCVEHVSTEDGVAAALHYLRRTAERLGIPVG